MTHERPKFMEYNLNEGHPDETESGHEIKQQWEVKLLS